MSNSKNKITFNIILPQNPQFFRRRPMGCSVAENGKGAKNELWNHIVPAIQTLYTYIHTKEDSARSHSSLGAQNQWLKLLPKPNSKIICYVLCESIYCFWDLKKWLKHLTISTTLLLLNQHAVMDWYFAEEKTTFDFFLS